MATTTVSIRIDETEKARLSAFLKARGTTLRDWVLSALDRDSQSNQAVNAVEEELGRLETRKHELDAELARIEEGLAAKRKELEALKREAEVYKQEVAKFDQAIKTAERKAERAFEDLAMAAEEHLTGLVDGLQARLDELHQAWTEFSNQQAKLALMIGGFQSVETTWKLERDPEKVTPAEVMRVVELLQRWAKRYDCRVPGTLICDLEKALTCVRSALQESECSRTG